MLDKEEKTRLFSDLQFVRDSVVRIETTQDIFGKTLDKQSNKLDQIEPQVQSLIPRVETLEKRSDKHENEVKEQGKSIVNNRLGISGIMKYAAGMTGAAALAALLVKLISCTTGI